MKNRIWRRIMRTGMAAVTVGAVLSAGFLPATAKSAEPEDSGVTIVQTGAWADQENGKAELNIRVEGIYKWLKEQKTPDEDSTDIVEDPTVAPEESEPENVQGDMEGSEGEEESTFESESAGAKTVELSFEETEAGELYITELNAEERKEKESGSLQSPERERIEADSEEWESEEIENPETGRMEMNAAENETEEYRTAAQQESEDEYEYMEELASGETVQQENEEKEKTCESTQEGETSTGEAVESGESEEAKIPNTAPEEIAVEDSEEVTEETPVSNADLTLVTYISEYFQPELDGLAENISIRPITVKNHQGKNTELTRIEYKINTEQSGEEYVSLRIPLTLREEYCYPAEEISCPLVQDEPLKKDRGGAGTFLLMEKNGTDKILSEVSSPVLEVKAAKADMKLSVVSETKNMKAGQTIRYKVELVNTGKLDLTDIQLNSIFSCPKIVQSWEEAEGLTAKGAQAQLLSLKAGEKRTLYVLAPLENEQEKPLEHKVEVKAQISGKPAETLTQSASVTNRLQELKADFTVKKTADREKVAPGETVTYQICIVNTGEKTLHSVVGTERFQAEGIEAYFVETEGIILNRTKTRALIEKIAPGDAVSLQAVVKLPEKTVDQKLLNQITVTSRETGSRVVEASSQITVEGRAMITQAEQSIEKTESEQKEPDVISEPDDSMARTAASHPRTGDETKTELFTLVLLSAGLTILGGIWLRWKYRKLHEENH